MLYECLVIDNSNFFKNGTIRVRIKSEVSSDFMMRDISKNPVEAIDKIGNQRYEKFGNEQEFRYDDEDVRVSSCIGGGYDYGTFILPQPNTWGILAEIGTFWDDRADSRFIWIGSIAMFSNLSNNINIPSDKAYSPNGYNNGEVNIDKPFSGFVFKQKETHISNNSQDITDESKKTLDWHQRPLQNMVVLNEDKVSLYHNTVDKDDKQINYSDLEMNKNGFKVNISNVKDNITSSFELNNNGSFNIINNSNKEKISNIISSNNNGFTVTHNKNDTNVNLSLGTDENGKSNFSINMKSLGNEVPTEIILKENGGIIINSSSDISINPGPNGNVTLGTGTGYILTTQAPGTWNLDNHTITAVRTVKA